jgi:hypothetical protein
MSRPKGSPNKIKFEIKENPLKKFKVFSFKQEESLCKKKLQL